MRSKRISVADFRGYLRSLRPITSSLTLTIGNLSWLKATHKATPSTNLCEQISVQTKNTETASPHLVRRTKQTIRAVTKKSSDTDIQAGRTKTREQRAKPLALLLSLIWNRRSGTNAVFGTKITTYLALVAPWHAPLDVAKHRLHTHQWTGCPTTINRELFQNLRVTSVTSRTRQWVHDALKTISCFGKINALALENIMTVLVTNEFKNSNTRYNKKANKEQAWKWFALFMNFKRKLTFS